ncbi:DUF4258 domain-containing protein [Methylomagnum sp.]
MWSKRFQKPVRLTIHARKRMAERDMDASLVLDILDNGTLKMKDESHFWAYKEFPERTDNLLCVAAINGEAIIVKTVMHHFSEK